MKLLTFLIPCYNVSDCVTHCLDSILSQAQYHHQIEVLAINDGSKDSTLSILKDYEQRFPNVVRVLDKANGGWGTVINLGIREAKGKYLKEIDADDWIESENLGEYLERLSKLDCDYIATEYKDYMKATDSFIPHTYQAECYNNDCTMADFWDKYPNAWAFPIHAITYRTELLQRIQLTVGDRYYTDLEYIMYPLPYVERICVLPINVSVYFHGNDEQSTGPIGYRKHYQNYLDLVKKLITFYQSLSQSTLPAVKECLRQNIQGITNFSYLLILSPLYAGCLDGIREERRQYDQWIKHHAPEFYGPGNQIKKSGIPYIAIWRKLGVNLLTLKKHA